MACGGSTRVSRSGAQHECLLRRSTATCPPDGRPAGAGLWPAHGGGGGAIGAIIGEWVGSAEGLGYVMLNANARLQTDICFAALFILVLLTLLLWLAVDTLLHRLIDWSPE